MNSMIRSFLQQIILTLFILQWPEKEKHHEGASALTFNFLVFVSLCHNINFIST